MSTENVVWSYPATPDASQSPCKAARSCASALLLLKTDPAGLAVTSHQDSSLTNISKEMDLE